MQIKVLVGLGVCFPHLFSIAFLNFSFNELIKYLMSRKNASAYFHHQHLSLENSRHIKAYKLDQSNQIFLILFQVVILSNKISNICNLQYLWVGCLLAAFVYLCIFKNYLVSIKMLQLIFIIGTLLKTTVSIKNIIA